MRYETYHLLCFELLRHLQEVGNVFGKAELFECFRDVFASNRLLRILFRYLVGLGRYHGDELHTTFDQQIA